LDVEENQVRVVLADEIDALYAVLALGYDINVTNVFEQEDELVAGELLIVHDYGRQRHSFS
jgi:hypothetical protein